MSNLLPPSSITAQESSLLETADVYTTEVATIALQALQAQSPHLLQARWNLVAAVIVRGSLEENLTTSSKRYGELHETALQRSRDLCGHNVDVATISLARMNPYTWGQFHRLVGANLKESQTRTARSRQFSNPNLIELLSGLATGKYEYDMSRQT